MKCSKVRLLLSEYIHEDLPSAKVAAVGSHIEACASCRREHAGFRAAISALDRPVTRVPAPDVLSSVMKQVSTRQRRVPVFGLVAATAVIVFALVAVWVLRPAGTGERSKVARASSGPISQHVPTTSRHAGVLTSRENTGVMGVAHRHTSRNRITRAKPNTYRRIGEPRKPSVVVYPGGVRVSMVDAQTYDASRKPQSVDGPGPAPMAVNTHDYVVPVEVSEGHGLFRPREELSGWSARPVPARGDTDPSRP